MITCMFSEGGSTQLRHAVVDCIVVKDSKVLLGKRSEKLHTEGGKWNLLAGYMDRDETAEQAAQREVMEESGWEVTNLRLLRVNDDPGRRNDERQNVTFAFVADAVKQTGEADWENDELAWFPLEALPPESDMAFDHGETIEVYKSYLKHRFPLPVIGAWQPK